MIEEKGEKQKEIKRNQFTLRGFLNILQGGNSASQKNSGMVQGSAKDEKPSRHI